MRRHSRAVRFLTRPLNLDSTPCVGISDVLWTHIDRCYGQLAQYWYHPIIGQPWKKWPCTKLVYWLHYSFYESVILCIPMRLARWQLAWDAPVNFVRLLPREILAHTESSLIGLSSERSKYVFSYLWILDSSRWKNFISWRYEDILCLGNVGNILRCQLIGNFVFYWAIMNASLPSN